MSSNRPAKALPRPSTDDPTFDAAALVVQTRFLEEDAEVSAAFKRLNLKPRDGDEARLASLFVPEVLDLGGFGKWDDAEAKKLKPKERAAYKAEHDAAYGRRVTRERYLGWLAEKLAATAVGAPKLAAALSLPKLEDRARKSLLDALRKATTPFAAAALLAAHPQSSWKALKDDDAALVKLLAELTVRAGRATAFDALAPVVEGASPAITQAILVGVDAASRPPGTTRFGVTEKQKLGVDPRWTAVATSFLASKHGDVIEAAVSLLRDLPVSLLLEAKAALEQAKRTLEKQVCSTDDVDELLAKLPKETAQAPKVKAKKSKGPLPPEARPKAPKLVLPKSLPVAELAEQLDEMLAKAKLGKHREVLVQPALHVFPKRVDEAKLAIGASKVGGLPDLPAGTAWPEHDGCPMGFVAQLRLEDLAALGETRLPPKGLLYFFVDDEPFGEGYLAKACVLHVATTKKLARTALPANFQLHRDGKPMRQAYAACSVTFVPTLTIPSSSNPNVTESLGKKECTAFERDVQFEHAVVSQLLGYRNHGYDAENPATSQLLFRMTSDAQADMEWGDLDCLDFYVPKKDLAKGVFDNVYPYVGD